MAASAFFAEHYIAHADQAVLSKVVGATTVEPIPQSPIVLERRLQSVRLMLIDKLSPQLRRPGRPCDGCHETD